ncbi:aminoacyl-tRNA hydrolase [Wolinella succinogenes]|uniref:aminoacyl-tRNA hydrolase n=1 Tax=Wolinella succinogenes TaxID=844 RepID=UPI002FC5BF8B
MVLVVGLGNPGKTYESTRHNIGFRVIDALLERRSALNATKSTFKGELHKEGENLFLKPTTYMNLSGESALPVSTFYKPEKILVIHDDLDLPFGAIRLKRGGGNGGHNGLKSLDKLLGNDYYRLRIGIGKPPLGWEVADYVLARFSQEEEQELKERLFPHAKEAIESFLEGKMEWDRLVSRYSLKPSTPKEKA